MSDVFAKRQPMIDFNEFERRLCSPRFTDQKGGGLLAEPLRIIGDKDEPHRTDFEPKTQLSTKARQDAAEPDEWKQPNAQVQSAGSDFAAIEAGLLGTIQPQAAILPGAERSTVEDKRPSPPAPLLSGDFVAIEAGLLGALQEQASATVSNAFPSVGLGSEHRLYQDNQPASSHNGAVGEHTRSRRPFYLIVACIIVGITGIAASLGLNSQFSSRPEIASIKADNGQHRQQTEATSSVDIPAQDAPILSKPPEPSPMALVNGNERTFELPQAEEKTPPTDSHALLGNGPTAMPVISVQAPTPAEPLGTAAPRESTSVKTDGTPPQTNIIGAQLPSPQSPAATKIPMAKAAGRVAKPQKTATAKHRSSHGQLNQIANKAKATPMSPLTTEPAPSADPEAESPRMQPRPVTIGALGFLQSAVNSLTSTTAKLFESASHL
jgi:hypothetical protein